MPLHQHVAMKRQDLAMKRQDLAIVDARIYIFIFRNSSNFETLRTSPAVEFNKRHKTRPTDDNSTFMQAVNS